MSIPLEFLNIVIPIASLKKCPSIRDVSEFLDERTYSGSGCWHDEYLYREGTMNDMDLEMALDRWKEQGLKLTRRRKGVEEWHDLCVVDTFSGPTLPCSWLEYDPKSGTVSMTASQSINRHTKGKDMSTNDDISQELKIALDSLKQSTLFQLSLASKELFHSNFIGWCCEVWPEQTAEIWSELVQGIPGQYSTEAKGKNIRREHNHHDIEIDFEGKILLVVELKVKSLALKKQLEDYAGKMKPKTRLVLMSLTEPDFMKKGQILKLANEVDCSWVDLSEMAQKFCDECVKGEKPSEAQVGKSSVEYLTGLLGDYAKFVVALKGVTTEAAKVEEEKRFFLRKADREAIKDLRLLDLVFKLRYQQLGEMVEEKVRKEFLLRNNAMSNNFSFIAEMSNATGMITVDLKLGSGERTNNYIKFGIGIQLQGYMCRQYVSYKKEKNKEGIGEKLRGICDKLRNKNLWLNDYILSDDLSNHSSMKNKYDYCKFDDDFLYNYRNLKEDISATEIIDYIAKRMVYLQSKEEEIIDIINTMRNNA